MKPITTCEAGIWEISKLVPMVTVNCFTQENTSNLSAWWTWTKLSVWSKRTKPTSGGKPRRSNQEAVPADRPDREA